MTDWGERKRGAKSLVREGEAAEIVHRLIQERGYGPPCRVDHPDAGGKCERSAVMEVLGMSFCDIHGEEAKYGCLEELSYDADTFLGLFDGASHVRSLNPEFLGLVRRGFGAEHYQRWIEVEEGTEPALLQAFPLIPERVDSDTQRWDDKPGYGTPYDTWRQTRLVIHKLMRLACQEGEDWLVWALEEHREMNAAQTAFALAHVKRWEEERRKERERANTEA